MSSFEHAPRLVIPASKSELIRALFLQSFEPTLEVRGDSQCEDVVHVRAALAALQRGEGVFHLGDSGLGLRCMALRVSRLAHRSTLKGTPRLRSRPHQELWDAIEGLGCRVTASAEGWDVEPPQRGQWTSNGLVIRGGTSSQFASAVLLAALELEHDFELTILAPFRSKGYLELTLSALRSVGVEIQEVRDSDRWRITVPAGAKAKTGSVLTAEGDWSTAAALLAVGCFCGPLELQGLSNQSLQPDRVFVDWLDQMGGSVRWQGEQLRVEGPIGGRFRGISVSGAASPDLIPVLAALACFAEGRTEVHSAPQLRHKESDRIANAVRLARFLGCEAGERDDGFWIEGRTQDERASEASVPMGVWSSDRDHRQVMAAMVAWAAGASFAIDDPTVVTKSAPEFLEWMNRLQVSASAPGLVLWGHRGTGKSALAQRLKNARGVEVVDLDAEIERQQKRSITSIFRESGEAVFRQLERTALDEALRVRPSGSGRVIVVGAGFEPQASEEALEQQARGYRSIWVARDTDAQGRIFLNRPRLNPQVSPVEEFLSRKPTRDDRYRELTDEMLILSEGADRSQVASKAEVEFLFGVPDVSGASITLPARLLGDRARLERWIRLRQNWPFRFFEIREDFFSKEAFSIASGSTVEQWFRVLRALGPERLVWSRRLSMARPPELIELQSLVLEAGGKLDWALELGTPTYFGKTGREFPDQVGPGDWVSLHSDFPKSGAPDVGACPEGVLKKWSPLVRSWSELKQGHEWSESQPGGVFLPRSPHGCWRYYRLWAAKIRKPWLHFLREDSGSAPDQPTILEWLQNLRILAHFGAVLGKPIFHSRSPERHSPHFYAFEVSSEDWSEAVAFLRKLGLAYAAVTSPLKEVAFEWAQAQGSVSTEALTLRSVNTLEWRRTEDHADRIFAHNTDLAGFRKVLQENHVSSEPTAVLWGGGGTAAMVRECLPQVVEYSARSGQRREASHRAPSDSLESSGPEVLVWAVGRSAFSGVFPPEHWRPRLLLDLNYAEDSPGLEYAQLRGLEGSYVSGLGLFEAQAQAQRHWWSSGLLTPLSTER